MKEIDLNDSNNVLAC